MVDQRQTQFDGLLVHLPNVDQVRAGDILLTFNARSGDLKGGKQSRVVAAATGGRFSHALICSTPPTFIEAIGTGVSTLSLGRYFAYELSNVRVIRYPDRDVATRAASLAQLEIGRDYSVARAVYSVFPIETLAAIEDHGTFCSALVAQVFANAGAALFEKTPVDRTTPATIDMLDGLEDITSKVFRAALAPNNIETMSALDGDRAPTLSAIQTELSRKCALAVYRKAEAIIRAFPELGMSATPTFNGLLNFLIDAIDQTSEIHPSKYRLFQSQITDLDISLEIFINGGEYADLLDRVMSEDDATIQRNLTESFKADPDIDVVAMEQYLRAGEEQYAQRRKAILSLERWGPERSAALRAYLPIDIRAAEAINIRNVALSEILGRIGYSLAEQESPPNTA